MTIEDDANFRPRTLFESLAGPRPWEVAMARSILLDRKRVEIRLSELGTFEEYVARLGREPSTSDYGEYMDRKMAIYREGFPLSEQLYAKQSRHGEIVDLAVAAVLTVITLVLAGCGVVLLVSALKALL